MRSKQIFICVGLVFEDEIAYFSHPFEFELFYENDDLNLNFKGTNKRVCFLIFKFQVCFPFKMNCHICRKSILKCRHMIRGAVIGQRVTHGHN